ncbi:GntR family transcriptional regulator [Mesorhizobium sp. ASY16-5R]|uniref:GntR family transcriptional regulator n=1 Tax=Mesorhizobium sp. ASY16-5R TaxID=3445772 RepID=UPI003FA10A31
MGATEENDVPASSPLARRQPIGATARVVDGLRRAIVDLEFKPGTKLDKAELTQRFGVSRFPIAEALNRLKAEGLVDIRPQSGSIVSRIRLTDARENMFLRRALEGEAVVHHAKHRSEQLLSALQSNMGQQKAAIAEDDHPRFHRLDLELHDMFVSVVGYPRVRAMVEGARLSLDRARRLLITPRRIALTCNEHAAIVAAIAAGDPLAARNEMSAHLDSVIGELEDFAKQNPALFDGS